MNTPPACINSRGHSFAPYKYVRALSGAGVHTYLPPAQAENEASRGKKNHRASLSNGNPGLCTGPHSCKHPNLVYLDPGLPRTPLCSSGACIVASPMCVSAQQCQEVMCTHTFGGAVDSWADAQSSSTGPRGSDVAHHTPSFLFPLECVNITAHTCWQPGPWGLLTPPPSHPRAPSPGRKRATGPAWHPRPRDASQRGGSARARIQGTGAHG